MKMTQQEIAEELEHQQTILRGRRANLRVLEKQEVSYGIDVPIHIVTQIERLTKQIHEHEEKIDQLETLKVEGVVPLAEVEYRVVVAEAWDNPQARPTVVGKARLEFARLRLHITAERAKSIQWEIREEIARYRIQQIPFDSDDINQIEELFADIHSGDYEKNEYEEIELAFMRAVDPIIKLHPGPVMNCILDSLFFSDREANIADVIRYKNRWLQLFGEHAYINESEDFKRALHSYLEPHRPYNPDEWGSIIAF